VIVNAVNDALRGFGVQLSETPLTPRRLLAALERARGINKPATP
jgi:aerobic carbon-monoxide dehydrogenase large subunit